MAFSLLQALIFGTAVGLLVYFRPGPSGYGAVPEETPYLAAVLPRLLDSWEMHTYDWRIEELSRQSTAINRVRFVPVDAETLAFIRGEPRSDVAGRPWSRALLGRLIQQMQREGAPLVMLDMPLADASPRSSRAPGAVGDDAALQSALQLATGNTVLGFEVSDAAAPSVGLRLHPLLLWVGDRASLADSRADLTRIFSQRRTAFLIPVQNRFQVWTGVEDEADARAAAKALQLKGPLTFRDFSASERKNQIQPVDLLLQRAEVTVEGLNPTALLQVRSLEPPVAPLLGSRASLGSFAMPRGTGGVVRGMPHLINYARDEGDVHVLPSAPLAAVMEMAGSHKLRYAKGRLYIGDKYSIPLDPNGVGYLAWNAAGAKTISAWRVLVNLLDSESGAPPRYPLDLAGAPVVFSDGLPSLTLVRTPLGTEARGAVMAQAMENFLSSRGIQRASSRWDITATFVLAFAGAFIALTLRTLLRTGAGALLYVLGLVGAALGYVLFARGMMLSELRWVAMAGPLIALALSSAATIVYAARTDLEVSDFITHVLGRYVSPDVARQVFRNVALMRPERRTVSVMFADIEGFGRLSEKLTPDQIAELLHEWLTEVTNCVHERGGQVEYAGDAVMAFWGAPVRHANHAERACATALAVQRAVALAQGRWQKAYGQKIEFRTGITTGLALVGDLGSALKSNYTVMGEVVRSAARLERSNRRFGTTMIVSQSTVEQSAKHFVFRELERVQFLSGRVESVYELLSAQREFPPTERARLVQYEEALALFRQRKFDEAAKRFEVLSAQDTVSNQYLQRSRELRERPPPANWDATSDFQAGGEAA